MHLFKNQRRYIKNKSNKRLTKKCISQLDWVMSLALFLLYLGWFFTFIIPNLNIQKERTIKIELLKNNFLEEHKIEKNYFSLFVTSEQQQKNKPIIVKKPFTQNTSFYMYKDNFVLNNYLFFISDIYEKNIFDIYLGENYNISNYYPILADSNNCIIENMSVDFKKELPHEIYYKNNLKIKINDYLINNISILENNGYFNKKNFAAVYQKQSNINFTTIIFSNNPEIYFILFLPEEYNYDEYINNDNFNYLENLPTYDLEINLELENYLSYYSDNNNYGDFDYLNTSQKININSDFVKIYSNSESLIFFFNNSEYEFESYNTTLLLKIKTKINYNNTIFKIAFDRNNLKKQDYDYFYGVLKTNKGIFLEDIKNYTYYKNKWNLDFYITIYNESVLPNSKYILYQLGEPLNKKVIYAKSEQINVYRKNDDNQYEFQQFFINYLTG